MAILTGNIRQNLSNKTFNTIRFILGDQLNLNHSWFSTKEDDTLYVIAELHQEQHYVKHHVQKICAFFQSMENFARTLHESGHQVLHLTLDDTAEFASLNDLLIELADQFSCQHIHYQHPDEFRLKQQFDALRNLLNTEQKHHIELACYDTEHFILPFENLPEYFTKGKHVRMETFYRAMRKRFNVLMESDQPLGGQWNYDGDNRQSFKKGDIAAIPEPLLFSNNIEAIIERLDRHNISHIGNIDATILWPCDWAQANQLLHYFCEVCLPDFGRFQDAITEQSPHAWSLYHSRLSFALNAKILHPLEVIDAAIEAFHRSEGQINLAQIEGFVRQILGWREYVRGMYWVNMPDISNLNALDATRPLPKWFWDGDTKMSCVRSAIKQSLDYAYAHHIQRLMVTGNFALLTGLNPDEVDGWYLGIYIDAIEWVELPNTRGMALSADGGLIATKPYASSGNYINKMSDHCKNCHYSVKEKVGETACPFNSLYWNFLDHHKRNFQQNPRMAFPYKTWLRMEPEQQASLLLHARKLLENLDDL